MFQIATIRVFHNGNEVSQVSMKVVNAAGDTRNMISDSKEVIGSVMSLMSLIAGEYERLGLLDTPIEIDENVLI